MKTIMQKKIVSVAICAAMILSFTACGSGEQNSSSQPTPSSVSSVAETETKTEPTSKAESETVSSEKETNSTKNASKVESTVESSEKDTDDKHEESSNESSNVETSSEIEETESKQELNVDKGLLSVEVTIPASLINDLDATTKAADENEDIISYKVNDDGSITYKYKKSAYDKFLDELRDSMDESFQEFVTEDNYPSIVSIEYDKKTFSDITIKVTEQSAYKNSFDSLIILGIKMNLAFYQAFSGDDEFTSTIHLVDNSNGNEFDTIIYPSDSDNDE